MKNKKKTLWNSLQYPEPVVFDERMEAIENRSYIWGFRIYTILIVVILIFSSFFFLYSSVEILLMILLTMVFFIVQGKTLYRCFYGILEVEKKKRSAMYNVIADCFSIGIFSLFYLFPYRNYISKLWYMVAFIAGFVVFYILCHIMYAQYLKSNEDDFNDRKKEHSQTIGILCVIFLGIFLIVPVVNMAINKDRTIQTLTQDEVDALDQIQRASDAYDNLEFYKLECFYTVSNEDNKPVYSNLIPNHSYYWFGSEESFVLVMDDNHPNNPVFEASYLKEHDSNMEWSIYYHDKWISEREYIENPEITGNIDEKVIIQPVTGILDIKPESVEDISVDRDENGYIYTVSFNDKYMTVDEYLKRVDNEKNKRKAIEIYHVNDFGVMTGYELQLTTYDKKSFEPYEVNMKFRLLSVNKEKIDEEISKLVNGKFESYTKFIQK